MNFINPIKNIILIVDDTPANLGVMAEFLDEAGLEVLVAEDGESALEKLKYVIPDLILLDVMMPGIDGFETYKRIKNNPQTSPIPVIFITAFSETSHKLRGFSLGAVDYITKPFHKEEVLARIRTHLELRRLTATLEQQNQCLLEEIEERNQARAAWQELAQVLDLRVQERTGELSEALEHLHSSQAQLKHDALHDSLTGLPNRTWLINRLEDLIKANSNYSVLFIDLDRFKVVNDSLGHLAGDALLKSAADRMQASLAPPNIVARLGGDEFVVLLESGEASEVAQQVLECFKKPFLLNNCEVVMGASVGITSNVMGYSAPLDPIRDADIAMYQAKQEKNGSYHVFNPQMQASIYARMQLEQDLRRAINQEEFCLHYQPIVCLSTGELKGFEALLRWHHPRGMISPVQFIPLAEETRLINSLGWWVLRAACSQLRLWQQEFSQQSLWISVNFSPIQFQQVDVVQKIAEILQETGVEYNSIKLEITESYLLNAAPGELQALTNLGVKLCVDDFGTGYSSLSRLQEFPIDTLKIDRCFVSKLTSDADEPTLIQIILLLAKSQNMVVVAEGIETKLQLEKLQKLGCGFGQGFLFSKPLDSQSATQFIRNQNWSYHEKYQFQ